MFYTNPQNPLYSLLSHLSLSERERERERERGGRGREREGVKERETDRQTDRQIDMYTERAREREREKTKLFTSSYIPTMERKTKFNLTWISDMYMSRLFRKKLT